MAIDKETSTRAEDVQKERQARIEKLIKTLEAGADKDDDKFRRVEKLDKERLKLAKKEEKFEDLGQKLWKSTFGGLFSGMGGAVPEPVKILGRMVGVAFGAKGRIKKKKKKLLQKAYKRAQAIGLDTTGWEDKAPEALEEIVENAELLHEIKMPDEPKATVPEREQNKLDPKAFLLTSKTQPLYDDEETAGVEMAPVSVPAEGGEGAFGSGLGGLSAAAEKAIIDLSEAGLKEGSIFVHDDLIFQANQRWQEEQEKRTDTPAQKKETRMDAAADRKKSQANWNKLFKLMKGGGGGGDGGGEGEGKGGFMGGFIKSVLNPKSAGSIAAGALILGNPLVLKALVLAGAGIGGFFGGLIAALGVGIAVLGLSLIALGKGLAALSEGMKGIPDALKGFEEVDGEKLAQAVTGMDGLFLALVGFGVGGWISKLADTEKLEAIPVVLKEFETIDGPALTKAGKGMKELAGGLAAMGVASVISAVGSFVSGGLSKLGELIGIKGPIAMLEEFSAVEIDSAKVKLNAEAMVTFGEAMAAAPVVNSTVVGGLFGAIVSAFGGTVEHPWDQVKKFGEIKFDTAQIKLNAEALAAFGTAMENLPAKVEGERVGGLFGAVADFFAGDVEMPWEQVKAFSEADLGDTAKVIANTSALVAFSSAMENMPAKIKGTREGGVFGAIASLFEGGVKMPWEQIKAFSVETFDTAKVKLNVEALVAFATAMENMPVKIAGTREGGVFGAIAGFFAGDVEMPWDQVKKFANADLGDLDKIKANTEKLVAFSEAMAYMPPDMEDPVIALPDFAEILNNIKAKFTGSIAAILSKIPTWLLPKKAEEWLAANKAATEAAAAPDVAPAPTPKADVVTEDAVTSGVVGDGGQQKPTQQEAMEAIIAERSKLTGPGSDTEYYRLSDEFEKLQSMTPEEFDAQTPDSAAITESSAAGEAERPDITKAIIASEEATKAFKDADAAAVKSYDKLEAAKSKGTKGIQLTRLKDDQAKTEKKANAARELATQKKADLEALTPTKTGLEPSPVTEKLQKDIPTVPQAAVTPSISTEGGATADLQNFMGSDDIAATHKQRDLEQGGGFEKIGDSTGTGALGASPVIDKLQKDVPVVPQAAVKPTTVEADVDKWGIDWTTYESATRTLANPLLIRDDQLGEQLKAVAAELRSLGTERETDLQVLQATYGDALGGLKLWSGPRGITFMNSTTQIRPLDGDPSGLTGETRAIMERANRGQQIATIAQNERQIPVTKASKGLVGLVKKPTLILAGEDGAESVDIRPSSLTQHSSSLTPAPGAGSGTMIVNAPDNSSIVSTSTNNQMSQDPGWAVFHTPVYARGSYAR